MWPLSLFDIDLAVFDHFFPIRYDQAGCFILILSIFCSRPAISQVSEESWLLLVGMVFRELNLAARGAHCSHSDPLSLCPLLFCFKDSMHYELLLIQFQSCKVFT